MIPLCLKKLKGTLSDGDFKALEAGVSPLLAPGSTSSSTAVIANPNAVCQVLRRALQDRHHVSFVLLLLRVLVLHVPVEESSDCIGCLAWIEQALRKDVDGRGCDAPSSSHADASVLSPTARAAAWLTLSNAATVGWIGHLPGLGSIVDCALVDWNPHVQPKAEVRQAASGFLYNVSLHLVRPNGSNQQHTESSNYNADDMITSILCFGLEGLSEETDATCRLRRCMILGRLLLQHPPATKASSSSSAQESVEKGNGSDTRSTLEPPLESTGDDNWQLRRTLAVELGIKSVLMSLIATASAQRSRDDSAALHSLAEELLSALV
jgi:hypothetical protein